MDVSFTYFRKRVAFDDPATSNGERAKWFLFYITKVVQLRHDMTPTVIRQRLDDLGWACEDAEILERFSSDPDIRPSRQRRGAYKITPVAEKQLRDYLNRQQKIFMSHRGEDKPLVKRVGTALGAAGCSVWFDEDSLDAGDPLVSGILKGIKESCAAVFFITPAFRGSEYLKAEVDYAVLEKIARPDNFRIISIVVRPEAGEVGEVPDVLKRYVYKECKHEADIIMQIIRSLPIRIGVAGWRDHQA